MFLRGWGGNDINCLAKVWTPGTKSALDREKKNLIAIFFIVFIAFKQRA
jgi:hypothetical protein